ALAETLPHLEPSAQEAAFEILLKRGHPPTLAGIVGGLNDHGDALRRLILAHANDLSAGVRIAISSTSFRDRASAIEIIVESNTGRLAYLLADALRARCRRTRELTAAGLHRMTTHLLDHLEAGPSAGEVGELNTQASCLAEALGMAVRRWELHFQPEVLEAAFMLGDRVEPVILQKLGERRTKIARSLNGLLEGTSNPRFAGFVLRALAIPELRSAAVRAISRARDPVFLRAVLLESRLLTDARIERGCRWIRDGQWLQDAVGVLLDLDEPAVSDAVRFLTATGGSHARRIELFRELIGSGREEVRRALVRQLVHDESEPATDVLTIVAARPGDSVAVMALREVRRRLGGARVGGGARESSVAPQQTETPWDAFDHYWNEFDELGPDERSEANAALLRRVADVGIPLRVKLASAVPLDRARALRIVWSLGVVKELEESVHHLAYDPYPVVRSLAVSLSAELPGQTTQRVLRAAVNDPDERVQANAIEAFDRLDLDERIRFTEPKLESPNPRVRANAIKSLLRVELRRAGDALLGMLEDPARAHRLSALWVIKELRSQAVLHRVLALSRTDSDERVRRRAKRVLDKLAGDGEASLHLSGRTVTMTLLSEPAPLTEIQRAVRDRFQEGGSLGMVVFIVLVLAGIVFIVFYLTRRQRNRDHSARRADPQRLFNDLLHKLDTMPEQRHLLEAVAKDLHLKRPAVILLCPALFDRYIGEWQTRQRSASTHAAGASRSQLILKARGVLFPAS
ncbi:MAG: HEAT repeat domain-containing protein, partial [Phycisphaerae bacterium]